MLDRLYIVGAAALALAMVSAWALLERGNRIAARAELAHAQDLLRRNEAALAQLRDERDRTVAALEGVAQRAAERVVRNVALRRAVHEAPATNACLSSPALAAALDGLRNPPRGTPGGATQAGGESPRVPGRTPSPAGR